MSEQVFLGGACGRTTWRADIAIPILKEAGVTFHNPQMGVGEWTLDDEASEMLTKDEADVLMFVVSNETRGVAAVAEACYLIGANAKVAVCLQFMEPGVDIEGKVLDQYECDDLNRGRAFLKSMAQRHNVPLFDNIKETTEYAVSLANNVAKKLTISKMEKIAEKLQFKDLDFNVEQADNGFFIWISSNEKCAYSKEDTVQLGRKWFVSDSTKRSEVVQTIFKAVMTWQEHEAREFFKYEGQRIYGPHFKVDELVELCNSRKKKALQK